MYNITLYHGHAFSNYLLPPTNEVWGKVMFYTCLSFCSPEGGVYVSLPVWLPGPMFLLGGSLSLVQCSFGGEGFCPRRVFVQGRGRYPGGGVSVGRPPHSKSEKQMVRILLGCFLVITSFSVT